MKKCLRRIERYRVKAGLLASDLATDGRNGAFLLPAKMFGRRETSFQMCVICSDATDWSSELGETKWEHVSFSWPDRCPTWEEMCHAKALFFERSETVLQFHPAEAEYVNCHETCLHLWRPIGVDFPTPPTVCVGPKRQSLRVLSTKEIGI